MLSKTVRTSPELTGEGPFPQAGMNRLCWAVSSRIAEESLTPTEECRWSEAIWFWGGWWQMNIFTSADIFKPGCGAGSEARNLNNQLPTASPELKTVVSPSLCQKEKNNVFILEIVWVNILQLSIPETKFSGDMCFFCYCALLCQRKKYFRKEQFFPVYPSLHKTVILLCSPLLKSSTRVNYNYLEVHILSFENAIFFWHSFHYQGIKY